MLARDDKKPQLWVDRCVVWRDTPVRFVTDRVLFAGISCYQGSYR
jgi:hypothetical protein